MTEYSDEERTKHEKHLIKHPNCNAWVTETGHKIPFIMLNDAHLSNVIRHLRNRVNYFKNDLKLINAHYAIQRTNETIDTLLKEKKKRLIMSTKAGKILYG